MQKIPGPVKLVEWIVNKDYDNSSDTVRKSGSSNP